ncbi:putative AAA+ superfamily ATPase [Algoriphagus sp. 4150]|uniref:DUF4143 domain-containing protein n=1 Tax=Algoriphagus sp. 4150 TaxID=2817756 RepID=UPI00285AF73C|nr:DUF4143 domain-containing protein [Algoriphagus sp. 4150]MDR7131138.1 putative AAA+ superfamily ATPase [Algoriphagus sp. 4150]
MQQLNRRYQNQSPWFWRDNDGDEVDLLLDKGTSSDIFEIKASETVLTENFRGLAKFESISSIPISSKGLVNAGSLNQKRSYGNVISWRDFPEFS